LLTYESLDSMESSLIRISFSNDRCAGFNGLPSHLVAKRGDVCKSPELSIVRVCSQRVLLEEPALPIV